MSDDEFGSRNYFTVLDYVFCGSMLVASLAIGVYYGVKGGGQKTSAEYILANRNMPFVPVTLSLLASFFSGISVQGIPADVYYHGPTILWIAIPISLSGVLALGFFLPVFYRIGMTSVYEYLQLRFNYVTKICGVFSFLMFSVFYMAVVTYTACVAVTAVTGIDVEVAIVCFCAICALYTVFGGIKAVLWTDSLQMLLMLVAVLAIIIKGNMEIGFKNMWHIAEEGLRTKLFNFNSDMTDFYNAWAMLIGQSSFAAILVTNQYMVQRMVICKSEATARASIVSFVIGTVIFQLLLVLGGFTLYAYYEGCDPKTMGYTTRNDQMVPYFIIDVFRHLPGIPGLLLAGLFGAALSTLSSVLNANATVIGHHFVLPYWKGISDTRYTVILKIIVVVSSVVALGVAFIIPVIGDAIPVVLTISGCSQGTLFALYIIGAFCPFCESKGAVTGYVVGLVVSVILSIGSIIFPPPTSNLPLSADQCLNDTYDTTTMTGNMSSSWDLYTTESITPDSPYRPVIFTLARSWLAALAFTITLVVAIVVSLATGGNDTSKMDPRLVFWKIKSSYVPVDKHKATEGDFPEPQETEFQKTHLGKTMTDKYERITPV